MQDVEIPDMAERLEVARLYKIMTDAQDKAEKASALPPEVEDRLNDLEDEYRRERVKLVKWHEAESEKIKAEARNGGEAELARKAAEEAEAAYEDRAKGRGFYVDDDGNVLLCAISKAPLWDDDDYVDYGEHTILASLIIPPDLLSKGDGDDGDGI